MSLEQRGKELAAIGAAIGCNCRPCIEHQIPAGREAGLSQVELAEAVARSISPANRTTSSTPLPSTPPRFAAC